MTLLICRTCPRYDVPNNGDFRRALDAQIALTLRAVGGLTTRQIAAAAGVAEGTIFSVFPDKPLGPVIPFDRAVYAQWRCYWPFGGGMFTDLFVHQTTHMIAAMGVRYPARVVGAGVVGGAEDIAEAVEGEAAIGEARVRLALEGVETMELPAAARLGRPDQFAFLRVPIRRAEGVPAGKVPAFERSVGMEGWSIGVDGRDGGKHNDQQKPQKISMSHDLSFSQ